MEWSARQYVIFEQERTRPVHDLLSAIPAINASAVIDIGCGPGNSTELLAARFPGAVVQALDNSLNMIKAARKRLPDIRFDVTDIADWVDKDKGTFDVILANAVLQWLPCHATLFPAMIAKLNPGGCLAVQIPDNLEEPAHRLMYEIANEKPWANKLKNIARRRTSGYGASWYFEKIGPYCTRLDIWRTTYYHPLAGGSAAIIEWFKGSSLAPFLSALDGDEQAEYLDSYAKALAEAYAVSAGGNVILPFPRLFILAIR